MCRLNFSHGTYEDHADVIQRIEELNEELGLNVAILADLQGPKIRTGEMTEDSVELKVGEQVVVQTDEIIGTDKGFFY